MLIKFLYIKFRHFFEFFSSLIIRNYNNKQYLPCNEVKAQFLQQSWNRSVPVLFVFKIDFVALQKGRSWSLKMTRRKKHITRAEKHITRVEKLVSV